MKIIKQSEADLESIIIDLKQGKTIVYPTETCYGLGSDATNQSGVEKVFEIKQRQRDKSVLILLPDMSMVGQYVDWTPKLEELSQKYWPGPLTVVAPAKDNLNLADGVVAVDGTVAFRVTDHPFAASLCDALSGPLVSTSANIAAQDSPYDIERVMSMFEGTKVQPDIIIDAGVLPDHAPSTVVRLRGDAMQVLRQGEIIIDNK